MNRVNSHQANILGHALSKAFENMGLKRQKDIFALTGVPQYQLSRIFKGDFISINATVGKLCKYAKIDATALLSSHEQNLENMHLPNSDVDGVTYMVRVFEQVWDGTIEHAEAIGCLVLATRSISEYGRNANQRKRRHHV